MLPLLIARPAAQDRVPQLAACTRGTWLGQLVQEHNRKCLGQGFTSEVLGFRGVDLAFQYER